VLIDSNSLLRDPKTFWLVCVVTYLSFGPTHAPFLTPSLYDNSRLLQVFALCMLSLMMVSIPSLRRGIARLVVEAHGRVRIALFSITALGTLSSFRAASPMMAVQEIALVLLLGLLALSVASLAIENRKAVDFSLLLAFEASALFFIVMFWMAQLAAIRINQPFEWIHPFVTFANVRHFSQFQAYTLPLLIVPLASVKVTPRWRMAAYLLAAHWWALQFAVGTRAIWFAGAFSAGLLFVFLRRDSLRYLAWLGLAIGGGAVLYAALNLVVQGDAPGLAEIGRRGFDSSNRRELWLSALGMVRESPFLGVGPMHFSFRNFEWAAHPHNAVLQWAAEYGLPAATIAVALMGYLLLACVRWAKAAAIADDRMLNVALLAALLMGLLDSLVSGNTLMPVSQMSLFVVIGWVIGRNSSRSADTTPSCSRASRFALSALCLACAITLGSGALSYYRYWDERQFFVPAGPSHPRHWEEGHWPTTKQVGLAVRKQ
jgi:O-antigen ligase